jgi:hypothetical protein
VNSGLKWTGAGKLLVFAASFVCAAIQAPAQAKPPLILVASPAAVPASTTPGSQGQIQSPSQNQTPTTSTTTNPRPASPSRTYSIRVRASVVGIGKDNPASGTAQSAASPAVQPATPSVPATRQQGVGQAQGTPSSLPPGGQNVSIQNSADSRGGFVEALDRKARWGPEQIKYASPGAPIQVKLIGSTIVSLIQLIPFEVGRNTLDIVASGQVWIMMPDGGIKYRTSASTLSVTLAERMFFFPLGYEPDGSSPLVVEIIVDRLAK